MTDSQIHDPSARRRSGPAAVVAFSGLASLGAGVIHAAAVGVHADARQASLVFVAIAVFQVGWGLAMLLGWHGPESGRSARWVALFGGLGNAALVGGWIVATNSGISFIDGLEGAVGASGADTVAAVLAGLGGTGGLVIAAASALVASTRLGRPVGSVGIAALAAVVAAATVPGLAAASSHADHDHAAVHDGEPDEVDAHEEADHAHHVEEADHAEPSEDTETAGAPAHDASGHVATTPYHPDLPIDLGGVDGVTPQQQAAAENLVAVTLLRLPRFADVNDAIAAGYYSFGDGITGHEHFLNWDLIDDGRILDPDYPESLVYETHNGERRLVSAMFMLDSEDRLDTVPDIGGALMQWHIHQDICTTGGSQPVFSGLRAIGGSCGSGVGFPDIPMIHVWIEPNECGPFAALKGIGAGQVAAGEETLCDHAHG